MSWFKWKEKIKFCRKATNAHGLHSPFVFTFYNAVKDRAKRTRFVSKNLNDFSKKENRIILAILHILKPAQVLVLSDEEQARCNWISILSNESQVSVSQNINSLTLKPTIFDLIILSKSFIINEKELISMLPSLISNDSVVIIPHIHASKNAISQWESLLEEKSVRVSIDLFFIGLLFFRKESTKQDFQLRF